MRTQLCSYVNCCRTSFNLQGPFSNIGIIIGEWLTWSAHTQNVKIIFLIFSWFFKLLNLDFLNLFWPNDLLSLVADKNSWFISCHGYREQRFKQCTSILKMLQMKKNENPIQGPRIAVLLCITKLSLYKIPLGGSSIERSLIYRGNKKGSIWRIPIPQFLVLQ